MRWGLKAYSLHARHGHETCEPVAGRSPVEGKRPVVQLAQDPHSHDWTFSAKTAQYSLLRYYFVTVYTDSIYLSLHCKVH